MRAGGTMTQSYRETNQFSPPTTKILATMVSRGRVQSYLDSRQG